MKIVKYINLKKQNNTTILKSKKILNNILLSGNYTNSKYVKKFENIYSKYNNFFYCVGCSSGTAASDLIFNLINFKKNDEILIPAHTFLSNLATLQKYNVTIKILDIDEHSLNLNLELIKKNITNKTKAILVCDMHGKSVDINKIYNFCKKKNIFLIQDSSQSHGVPKNNNSLLKKKFFKFQSFYPTKNLGSITEGGCILTNDKIYKKKLDLMRSWSIVHGKMKYSSFNYRMNELCAGFLINKLKILKNENKKRIKIAEIYLKSLKNLVKFQCSKNNVYYNFIIRVDKKIRSKLVRFLEKQKIEITFHYKIIPHKQLPLKKILKKQKKLINVERLYNEMMTLPCSPDMSLKEVTYIINNIKKFFLNYANKKI